MRTDEKMSEISITETPEGEFVARYGGMSAQGSTAGEAESLLLELLDEDWQGEGRLRRPAIVSDSEILQDGLP